MNSIDYTRVVVLAGGISHERDVSLRSGRRVADSLAELGISVELRDQSGTHVLSADVEWFIAKVAR